MKKKISGVLAAIALLLTGMASTGCILLTWDEPKANRLKNFD